MPRSEHYEGHGDEVYASMKKTYKDTKVAKRVFYATERKRKNKKNRKRSTK